MEYLVTLIETTEHIVSVEADDECLARGLCSYRMERRRSP